MAWPLGDSDAVLLLRACSCRFAALFFVGPCDWRSFLRSAACLRALSCASTAVLPMPPETPPDWRWPPRSMLTARSGTLMLIGLTKDDHPSAAGAPNGASPVPRPVFEGIRHVPPEVFERIFAVSPEILERIFSSRHCRCLPGNLKVASWRRRAKKRARPTECAARNPERCNPGAISPKLRD